MSGLANLAAERAKRESPSFDPSAAFETVALQLPGRIMRLGNDFLLVVVPPNDRNSPYRALLRDATRDIPSEEGHRWQIKYRNHGKGQPNSFTAQRIPIAF